MLTAKRLMLTNEDGNVRFLGYCKKAKNLSLEMAKAVLQNVSQKCQVRLK